LNDYLKRPVKEGKDNKIDGAVAALMAFISQYQPEEDDEPEPELYI
jgi:phage terminase large subunit-like protein